MKTDKAYFAGGCFWGVEYYLKTLDGVLSTIVGYSGGAKENPTYEEVCNKITGHAEAIEVIFDSDKTSYEELAKYFFSIHDFTQINRQGPDVGEQYRSEIFYVNDEQKKIAEKIIDELTEMGYEVATKLTKFEKFWDAEDYHQDYYTKTGKLPYCHTFKKIW